MTSSNPVIAELKACEMDIINAIEAQFDIHAMDPEDWAEMSCAIDAALSAFEQRLQNTRASTPPPGIEPEAADRGVRRFGALATAEDLEAADEATITEALAGHIALCKEGASWIRDLCAERALLRESLSMFVDAAKPRRKDGFHEMPLFHARELEIARQSLRSEQEDGR